MQTANYAGQNILQNSPNGIRSQLKRVASKSKFYHLSSPYDVMNRRAYRASGHEAGSRHRFQFYHLALATGHTHSELTRAWLTNQGENKVDHSDTKLLNPQ